MKKIIALILAVGCVFTLCSCKWFKKNKDEGPQFDTEAVAAIQAKIDASKPQTAFITVALKASLGDLKSEYDVTYNDDGTATVVYTYEKFNSFEDESADDYKSTDTGTVTVNADGTLSEEFGGVASVEALTFDINLDSSKIATATVLSGVLNATVKAENTEAVLGVNLGVDATVVVSTGTLGVASVAISYASEAGNVEIVATYLYPAPSAE